MSELFLNMQFFGADAYFEICAYLLNSLRILVN